METPPPVAAVDPPSVLPGAPAAAAPAPPVGSAAGAGRFGDRRRRGLTLLAWYATASMRKVTWKRASGGGTGEDDDDAVAAASSDESTALLAAASPPPPPSFSPAPPVDDRGAGGGEEKGWSTFGGGGGGEGIEGWRIMPAGSGATGGTDDGPTFPESAMPRFLPSLSNSGGSGCVDEDEDDEEGGVLDEKNPAGMEAFPTGSRSQPSMHLGGLRACVATQATEMVASLETQQFVAGTKSRHACVHQSAYTSRQTVVPKMSVTQRELVPRRTKLEFIFKAHAHRNKTSEV